MSDKEPTRVMRSWGPALVLIVGTLLMFWIPAIALWQGGSADYHFLSLVVGGSGVLLATGFAFIELRARSREQLIEGFTDGR